MQWRGRGAMHVCGKGVCCTRAQFVFMDNETYEETRLKRDEAWAKYLKEGADVNLLFWNGKVGGMRWRMQHPSPCNVPVQGWQRISGHCLHVPKSGLEGLWSWGP